MPTIADRLGAAVHIESRVMLCRGRFSRHRFGRVKGIEFGYSTFSDGHLLRVRTEDGTDTNWFSNGVEVVDETSKTDDT